MRFLVFLLALLVALADGGAGLAAKKKKDTPQSPPKLIYEAPMTVVIVRNSVSACEPNCPEWIAAEGEITDGTPTKFREVFKRMGKKQLPIIIRSPGGSINAALEIGKMIRKRKLDVAVGSTQFNGCGPNRKDCKLPKEHKGIYRGTASSFYGFCNSACPLILAAGTTRLASFDTSVGVHKPKVVWNRERVYYRETYRMVNGKKKVLKRTVTSRKRGKDKVTFEFGKQLRKKLANYYASMGVDPAIMVDSEKAAYKEMEILRGARLDELKLRTGAGGVALMTDGRICTRNPQPSNCVPLQGQSKAAQKQAVLTLGKNDPAQLQPISDRNQAMSFKVVQADDRRCAPNCPRWIAARGNIVVGTRVKLADLLKSETRRPLAIVLDSPGGDLREAMQLGYFIRLKALDTVLGVTLMKGCKQSDQSCAKKSAAVIGPETPTCHGACVYVFAAGKERIMPEGAGMTVNGLAAGNAWSSIEANYFKEMGTTVFLIEEILNSRRDDVLQIQSRKARGVNIATLVPPSAGKYFEASACSSKDAERYCTAR